MRYVAAPSRRPRLGNVQPTPKEEPPAERLPRPPRWHFASLRALATTELAPPEAEHACRGEDPVAGHAETRSLSRLVVAADAALAISRVPSTRTQAAASTLTAMPVSDSREGSVERGALLVEVTPVSEDDEANGAELAADDDDVATAAVTAGRAVVDAAANVAGVDVAHTNAVGTARRSGLTSTGQAGDRADGEMRLPYGAWRDAEVRRLDETVLELRKMVEQQGQILTEQNRMLSAIYAAGSAAASALAEARTTTARL
jgi:hypothetical protein